MHRPRAILALPVLLLAAVLATQSPAGGQDIPTCNGLPATIVGTDGRDNLRGTPGDDVIVGLGGPDRIVGLGGNDTICGGEGRDRIRGNNGKDTIFGEGGRDRIHGGGGADTIYGNGGNDRLYGGNADDVIRGNRGIDFLLGDAGDNDCVDSTTAVLTCEPLAEGQVRFARDTWQGHYVVAEIYVKLLREMGYDVNDGSEIEHAPFGDAYGRMAQGEFDAFAVGVFPWHADDFMIGNLPDGTSVRDNLTIARPGGAIDDAGLQGFLVTKAWADQEGFVTLEEINADPELWGALDSDENGKGEILGCASQTPCLAIIDAMIAFNSWDNLEQRTGNFDPLADEFIANALAGEPAVIYGWSPSETFARAHPGTTTMWLSVQDESVLDDSNPLDSPFGGDDLSQRRDGVIGSDAASAETCLIGPDGCQLGFLTNEFSPAYNSAWGARNPQAQRLLELVTIEARDVSLFQIEIVAGGIDEADVRRLADEWIAANRSQVNTWLNVALQAG